MLVKLIHAADVHLGRRRLDGKLPEADFARAFDHIAAVAVAQNADAVLLAGDVFDRPQVEPPHLRQAQEILAKLKAAGIPVIAVNGNHDKPLLNSDAPTWLDYLAEDDLLVLLGARFGPEGAKLEPWTRQSRRGSWFDLQGVRFVGAGYLGAATPHKTRQIIDALEPGRTHVMLLHAGPDYFVGEGGGFAAEDLRAIREKVSYLALGHIHKPMLHEGWACNPGSPENCDLTESSYDRDRRGQPTPRGYAWVELDPASPAPLQKVEIRANPRRPVLQLELDCTPFGNKLKDGAAALEKAACQLIRQRQATGETVISLRLAGRINIGRLALDLAVAARNIEQAAEVLAVAFDASTINLDGVSAAEAPGGEALSREQIERAAIRQRVEEEHLWGLDGEQEAVANLFYELKEGILSRKSVEELAERIHSHALLDQVTLALSEEAENQTP